MNKFLLAAAIFAATTAPAAAATAITVANVGSILNESISLPAELTPGAGGAFAEFFEFSLPTRETVTLSMTDSAIGTEQITSGLISLNDWTATGPSPTFIPLGALIESAAVVSDAGGQHADVTPDALSAGNYFAEVSGLSGSAPIKIAIDSTVTATTVPEPATWVMLLLGAALIGWSHKRVSRPMVDSPT